MNSPRTANYHLEISVSHQELADSIRRIMDRFFLSARITERKSLWVVYIKAGDKIGDFLRLIDASMRCCSLKISAYRGISTTRCGGWTTVNWPMK